MGVGRGRTKDIAFIKRSLANQRFLAKVLFVAAMFVLYVHRVEVLDEMIVNRGGGHVRSWKFVFEKERMTIGGNISDVGSGGLY